MQNIELPEALASAHQHLAWALAQRGVVTYTRDLPDVCWDDHAAETQGDSLCPVDPVESLSYAWVSAHGEPWLSARGENRVGDLQDLLYGVPLDPSRGWSPERVLDVTSWLRSLGVPSSEALVANLVQEGLDAQWSVPCDEDHPSNVTLDVTVDGEYDLVYVRHLDRDEVMELVGSVNG